MKSLGLKTTDYLVFDLEKADTVVPQLRKYLNAGWTFFTLASFCEKGCGHYFWITDIDAKGNILPMIQLMAVIKSLIMKIPVTRIRYID